MYLMRPFIVKTMMMDFTDVVHRPAVLSFQHTQQYERMEDMAKGCAQKSKQVQNQKTITDCDDSILRRKFTKYVEKMLFHSKVDYVRMVSRYKNREVLMNELPEDLVVQEGSAQENPYSERLDTAISMLPERKKKLLICFYVHGMGVTEIASLFGYKVSYVYKLKHETISALREALLDQNEGGSDE